MDKSSSNDTSIDPDTYFAMEDIHHEIEEMAYKELCQKLSLLTRKDTEQDLRMEETRREIRERALQIVHDRMRIRNIDIEKAALFCICKDRKWKRPYSYRNRLIDIPNIDQINQSVSSLNGTSSEETDEGEVRTMSDAEIDRKGRTEKSRELKSGVRAKEENVTEKGQIRRKYAPSKSNSTSYTSQSDIIDAELNEAIADENIQKATKSKLSQKQKGHTGLSYEQRKQIGYAHVKDTGKPTSSKLGSFMMGEEEVDIYEQEAYDYDTLLYSTIGHLGNYYFDGRGTIENGKISTDKYYEDMKQLSQELDMQEGYDMNISSDFWIRKMIDHLIDFQLLILTSDSSGYTDEIASDSISDIVHFGEQIIKDEIFQEPRSLTSILSPPPSLFAEEDLQYLRTAFGNSLILAMASTTMAQPTSPIAYFAQFLVMNKNIPDFVTSKKDDLDYILKLKETPDTEFDQLYKLKTAFKESKTSELDTDGYKFNKVGKIILGRGKRLRKDIIDACNKMVIETPLYKISRAFKKAQMNKSVISSIVTLRERLSMEVDLIKQEEKALLYEEVISILQTFLPDLENMKRSNVFLRYLSEFVGVNRILTYQGPTSTISFGSIGRPTQPHEALSRDSLDIPKKLITFHHVDIDEIVSRKLTENIKDVLDGFSRRPISEDIQVKAPFSELSREYSLEEDSSISHKFPCQRQTQVPQNVLCNALSTTFSTHESFLPMSEISDVVKIANDMLKRTSITQTADPYTKFRLQSQFPLFTDDFRDDENKILLLTMLHIEKEAACAMCEHIEKLIEMKKSMAHNIKEYEIDYVIGWITESVAAIIDQKFNAKSQEKSDDKIMLLNNILPIFNNKLVFQNQKDVNHAKEKFTYHISKVIDQQINGLRELKRSEKKRINKQISDILFSLFPVNKVVTKQKPCCCDPQNTEYFYAPKNDYKVQNIETQVVLEDILYMLVDNLNQLDLNIDSLLQIKDILESFVTRAARKNPYISTNAKSSFLKLLNLIFNMYARKDYRTCYCKWILYLATTITEEFDRVEKIFDALYFEQKQKMELEIMKMFAALVDGLTLEKLQAQVMC